jgi:integrase/recombinase XerD
MLSTEIAARRSPITQPGYGLGRQPANAGKTYPAEVYTRQEIARILEQLAAGYLGARNRALVVILWRCGLRVEEALALAPHDIDLHDRTLLVRHGKNNRQRSLGLDPPTVEVLEEWTDRRRDLGFTPDDPLFPVCYGPTRGKRIYSSDLRDTLKTAGVRAGIRRRVHPHGFRHTFASECIREGIPLPILSVMMGHKDLAYTFGYVRKVAPWEAIHAMQQRSWPTHQPPPRPSVSGGGVG